ncbi:hypothetical protein [Halomonas caseinilytica]|uniref:hypothetical protein n=1 Tax=Halomonas caseinilytica TaxID=438744 RepID=UPI0008CC39A3|nr:hypothetical protein [Halomonas caseinilytica]SEN65202.1 hypothetical protein SAMN04487952_12315 [Halomonas caseinilytica]
MEPCDPHFLGWWRIWLKQQAGIANLQDYAAATIFWQMSFAAQRKLGALDD